MHDSEAGMKHALPDSPCRDRARLRKTGCGCTLHSRRLFTGGLLAGGSVLAWPALGREGVDVGARSSFANFVSADQIEQAAGQ